jgi:hypothetical protein
MIQRVSDGKYFRFATGTGVNTHTSPSVKGPWTDVGAALPDGSNIHIDGVDSKDIWVRIEKPNYKSTCFIVRSKTPRIQLTTHTGP